MRHGRVAWHEGVMAGGKAEWGQRSTGGGSIAYLAHWSHLVLLRSHERTLCALSIGEVQLLLGSASTVVLPLRLPRTLIDLLRRWQRRRGLLGLLVVCIASQHAVVFWMFVCALLESHRLRPA